MIEDEHLQFFLAHNLFNQSIIFLNLDLQIFTLLPGITWITLILEKSELIFTGHNE